MRGETILKKKSKKSKNRELEPILNPFGPIRAAFESPDFSTHFLENRTSNGPLSVKCGVQTFWPKRPKNTKMAF
jgi:hypothetical protein